MSSRERLPKEIRQCKNTLNNLIKQSNFQNQMDQIEKSLEKSRRNQTKLEAGKDRRCRVTRLRGKPSELAAKKTNCIQKFNNQIKKEQNRERRLKRKWTVLQELMVLAIEEQKRR